MKLTNGSVFSDAAWKLLLDFEGMDQPGKWPGVDSGISIGIGCDLGYMSRARFLELWAGHLPADVCARLGTAVGVKGRAAAGMAPSFKDIKIPAAAAHLVFRDFMLPEAVRETKAVFPGVDMLPLDAQGALVSLVYNRGGKLSGERRREMRNIVSLVAAKDLWGIAQQIRKMKRLWPNYPGLRRRRDAEAALVEKAA